MTVDRANDKMVVAGRAIFLTWFASTLVGMITLKVYLDKVEVGGRMGEMLRVEGGEEQACSDENKNIAEGD